MELGGGARAFFFLWRVDVCELNSFGSCVEEGSAHQAHQMGLAVREVTAAPGTFPDSSCSTGASGIRGSFSLPECQGTSA